VEEIKAPAEEYAKSQRVDHIVAESHGLTPEFIASPKNRKIGSQVSLARGL